MCVCVRMVLWIHHKRVASLFWLLIITYTLPSTEEELIDSLLLVDFCVNITLECAFASSFARELAGWFIHSSAIVWSVVRSFSVSRARFLVWPRSLRYFYHHCHKWCSAKGLPEMENELQQTFAFAIAIVRKTGFNFCFTLHYIVKWWIINFWSLPSGKVKCTWA